MGFQNKQFGFQDSENEKNSAIHYQLIMVLMLIKIHGGIKRDYSELLTPSRLSGSSCT